MQQHRASCPLSCVQRLGSLSPHVRNHLAEEARRFEDGRLRLYEYTPMTEHIQREREGPQHGQTMGEVQRRRRV